MTSSNDVRILHVLGRLNRGGAEMRILEVMRNIDRQRYRFEFCCLSGLPGELDEEVRSLGGAVHLLPLGARFPRRFRSLVRSRAFDVVHSHVHWPSGYILRLAALENVPQRICQFASTSDGKPSNPVRKARTALLKRWIAIYATSILGVSEGALSANWGEAWLADPRFGVIYRGIDMSQFRSNYDRTTVRSEFQIPTDAFLVIHVGRMDPPKNHGKLLDVFRCIASKLPNSYLLLVGAVRTQVELSIQRVMSEPEMHGRILIAGVRSDVPKLLGSSDVMIFPSQWEGLPGAVLEALAAEIPVIASDLPGIAEIARYLPGIRMMSLQSSDEEWARVALEDRDHGGSVGIAERDFSQSPFSIERSVESYERLYTSSPTGLGLPQVCPAPSMDTYV